MFDFAVPQGLLKKKKKKLAWVVARLSMSREGEAAPAEAKGSHGGICQEKDCPKAPALTWLLHSAVSRTSNAGACGHHCAHLLGPG